MHIDPIFYFFLAGALGALVNDLLKDNSIELPRLKDGNFYLGFIGSLILGGIAGQYIDGGILTAFMGGFMGKAVIGNLTPKNLTELLELKKKKQTVSPIEKKTDPIINETVEQIIRRIAKKNDVDVELAVKVAKCESALIPNATNTNKNGTIDRGVFQWNNYYHPEVDDKCAFDVECATQKFCEALKSGNLSWWNASKKCWNK